MTDFQLRNPLGRQHRSYTNAVLAHFALRAAAACTVAIGIAVLLGVAWPTGVAGAWLRLASLSVGAIAILFVALSHVRRHSRTLDGWLDLAEQRFPELRSWLRNALELERASTTPDAPVTSNELAAAVVAEGAR
ncbi:MAG: hypothetical protein HOP12_09415, partial [Candidatus Eisenbacteria bacterium]|nr:hypothetical protein [Candidatus Eisenbacteria bacterium]